MTTISCGEYEVNRSVVVTNWSRRSFLSSFTNARLSLVSFRSFLTWIDKETRTRPDYFCHSAHCPGQVFCGPTERSSTLRSHRSPWSFSTILSGDTRFSRGPRPPRAAIFAWRSWWAWTTRCALHMGWLHLSHEVGHFGWMEEESGFNLVGFLRRLKFTTNSNCLLTI